jgi:putative tryptophan/tyrosine transport system substrate-binding protein
MTRREFITFLGGAAAAWPLAARAQPPAMPVIGFLHPTSLKTRPDYLTSFHRGLGEKIGYIEGKNVAIEYRSAQGQNNRFSPLVAELVRHQVAVIVLLESTHSALSAKQ